MQRSRCQTAIIQCVASKTRAAVTSPRDQWPASPTMRNARSRTASLGPSFSQRQTRPPHLFEQPYGFHHAMKADRGCDRELPYIPSEVFIRGGVDAEPGANQIADRFRLKLTNGK